jgi:hypothetical protein
MLRSSLLILSKHPRRKPFVRKHLGPTRRAEFDVSSYTTTLYVNSYNLVRFKFSPCIRRYCIVEYDIEERQG